MWSESLDDPKRATGHAPAVPGGGEIRAGAGPLEGRYDLLDVLGVGGMGVVRVGRDRHLGRELAVKLMKRELVGQPRAERRFLDEARIKSRLQHPAIPPVYELVANSELGPFFTMKLVEGQTLEALLKDLQGSGEDRPRLLRILERVSQGVAHAHEQGIVHLDLSTKNVMVDPRDDLVQVMDWGLARDVNEAVAGGGAGPGQGHPARAQKAAGGTPGFMAPEVLLGRPAHTPADVFALGSILCRILTGRPAYAFRSPQDLLRQAAESGFGLALVGDARGRLLELRVAAEAAGEAEEARLIALAFESIDPEPANRPADAKAFGARLATYLGDSDRRRRDAEVELRAAKAREAADRRRRRMAYAAMAAALVAIATGGGALVAADRRARRDEADVREAVALAQARFDEATRGGPGEGFAWDRAREAAARADHVARRVPTRRDLARQVDAMAAVAQRGWRLHRLAARLDEARLAEAASVRDGHFDSGPKLDGYAAAFAEAGVPFGSTPVAEIIALLQGAGHAQDIAAALDDWEIESADAPFHADLIAVAEAIDPACNDVRRCIRGRDAEALIALVRAEGAGRIPVSGMRLVAQALQGFGRRPLAAPLLEEAIARGPGDFWLNHELGVALLHADPPRPDEAVRYLTAARSLRPTSPGVRLNLGNALARAGRTKEAESEYRAAIHLQPEYGEAHFNLGYLLEDLNRLAEAEASYREAIRHRPKSASAQSALGLLLLANRRVDEAVKHLRIAVGLDPGDAKAHVNLGNGLNAQGSTADAEASYHAAIERDPGLAGAYSNLASLMQKRGSVGEAEAMYRRAADLAPGLSEARQGLGQTLKALGRLEEAERELAEAVRLDPKDAGSRFDLADLLARRGQSVGAEKYYREAIKLQPAFAEAHCNLGQLLRLEGRFREALEELRIGHAQGSARPDWPYPSARWVKACEALTGLEGRLPALLSGAEHPRDNAERLLLGELCYDLKRFVDAADFYGDALRLDPELGADRGPQYRYNAACAALRAATDVPGGADRAALRARAYDWLRLELKAWKVVATGPEPNAKSTVDDALRYWKEDPDLTAVRDKAAVPALPDEERASWRAFWSEVDGLLREVAGRDGEGGV
ncbi:serine/threonine-protein kinase [Aquisphaera giovannonii]|uniref:serine/threonine-protein kinase n=1 Tax=Aquisphaera giovannonii TaxID=406548 RepID=UPI001AEF62FA|nr:serine/threonine-protein kinase [Aquisphaera giovannonii]